MNSDAAKARSIFISAVEECPPEQWDRYLDDACRDDVALRRRVELLLRAHQGEDSFLDRGDEDEAGTIDRPIAERPGTQIGPYKLMEQIGEGGMGLVFVAEQERPVRRKVALKVIKPGMDTREVIARFEAERQALALMDHPNIAKVHDAGATENGRPYFVMELVPGVPITEYCDQCNLTTVERLELFVAVCQAVQHAHQKGVIHRDIKPTNVLVMIQDGRPAPKIIDFGVAKAINQRLTEHTLATGLAQIIGTPMYMSPEQAELSPLGVDTRSDIYSLGVLLYELLTGTTPFDRDRLRAASYDELRRIIREEEPPRPSARLSTLAADQAVTVAEHRRTDARRLRQTVRGELDWIVMKCLEKDRNRRYETANGLARDIERYLNDEAVQACPPSAGYRLRKFARRNKRAIVTATIVGAMLLVALGAVAGSIGWVVRDRGIRQSSAESAARQALDDVWRLATQERWPEAMEAAKRAEASFSGGGHDKELAEQVQAALDDMQMVLDLEGIRLQQSGERGDEWDFRLADPAYAEAFRRYGIDVAALSPEAAAAQIRARRIRLELAAALDDWAAMYRLGRRGLSEPVAAALDDWAAIHRDHQRAPFWKQLLAVARLADPDETRNQLRDVWEQPGEARNKLLEPLADPKTAGTFPPRTLLRLAHTLRQNISLEKAIPVLRVGQQQHPGDFWINYMLANYLGDDYQATRKRESAAEGVGYLRAALALRPQYAAVYLRLARLLQTNNSQVNSDEAHRLIRRGIEKYGRMAVDSRDDLDQRLNAAYGYTEVAKLCAADPGWTPEVREVERRLFELLETVEKESVGSAEHRELVAHIFRYWAAASPRTDAFRPSAIRALLRAIAVLDRLAVDFPDNPIIWHWFADTHQILGRLYEQSASYDEAEKNFRRAVKIFDEHAALFDAKPINKSERVRSYVELASILVRRQRIKEAEGYYRKALDLIERSSGVREEASRSDSPRYHVRLAELLLSNKPPSDAQKEEAYRLIRRAIERYGQVAVDSRDDVDLRLKAADGYLVIAKLCARNPELTPEVREVERRLFELLDSVERESVGSAEHRQQASDKLRLWAMNAGRAAAQAGNRKAALKLFAVASRVLEQAVVANAGSSSTRVDLSNCYVAWSEALFSERRFEESLDVIRKAISLLDQAMIDLPAERQWFLDRQAHNHRYLGFRLWNLRKYAAARDAFETSSEVFGQCEFHKATALHGRANNSLTIGRLWEAEGRREEARKAYGEALARYETVLAQDAVQDIAPDWRNSYYGEFAGILEKIGTPEDALRIAPKLRLPGTELGAQGLGGLAACHFQLARLLQRGGRLPEADGEAREQSANYEEAEKNFRRAVKIFDEHTALFDAKPINDFERVLSYLELASFLYDHRERMKEAEAFYRKGFDLIERSSRVAAYDTFHYVRFGLFLAATHREQEAAEFVRKAARNAKRVTDPTALAHGLYHVALLQVRLGDDAGYRTTCKALFDVPVGNLDHDTKSRPIWTPCLAPDALEDLNLLVKRAEEFASDNSLAQRHFGLYVLGAALYRAGQYEQAAQRLKESIIDYPSDPLPNWNTINYQHLLLAMTKWQLGQKAAARQLLAETQPAIDKELKAPSSRWMRRATLELLRREAEALIGPKKADEGPNKDDPKPTSAPNIDH
jgi:serine/threonine protein kinase/tetratricopeptide (TPR) repeat protein